MSEIVDTLLNDYKDLLGKESSISSEIVAALKAELGKEQPNANVLAEILRRPIKEES